MYTKTEKKEIINRYLNGERISSLSKTTDIARSTIYLWIKEYNKKSKLCKEMKLRDIHDLKIKSERQEKMLEIIKLSGCTANSTQIEKYNAITALSSKYNVNTICQALGIAKGSYYNHIFRAKKENTYLAQHFAELKNIIEKTYNEHHQIPGAAKITALIKEQGYKTTEKTVAKILHENGWFSIRKSAKELYLKEKLRKENILRQEFHATRPNEIWVSDITYYEFKGKQYYICAIMDLYARRIVACKVSDKITTQLTKTTFNIAYENRKPTSSLLFHSDQGRTYTSRRFMSHLRTYGIIQSFSRKRTPCDNSVMESFFATMKQEELYRTRYKSQREFKESVAAYIEYYNSNRPHSTLRFLTPNKVENTYYTYIKSDNNGS